MSAKCNISLVQGERVLLQSNDGSLTLTTHRVRLDRRDGGDSKVIGLTLDAVASCGLATRSYPAILGLGFVLCMMGLALVTSKGTETTGSVMFLASAASLLAYLLSRAGILEISSAGAAISVRTKGMSREAVLAFVEELERAKLARLIAQNRA